MEHLHIFSPGVEDETHSKPMFVLRSISFSPSHLLQAEMNPSDKSNLLSSRCLFLYLRGVQIKHMGLGSAACVSVQNEIWFDDEILMQQALANLNYNSPF